jgi:hypothetical protein
VRGRSAAVLLVLAISCTSTGGAPQQRSSPGGGTEPDSGGSITLGVLGEPATLDPYSPHASLLTAALIEPLYPSLFEIVDGSPRPQLAAAIDIEEGRARITLREEATWSDNRSVTSADVVASWRRAGPDSGFGRIRKMTADGPTVVIAEGVRDRWEEVLADGSPVLPRGRFNAQVSGGPFAIGARRPGLSITLERSEGWWGEPALLDRVEIQHIDSVEIMIELLASKELDAAWVPSSVNLSQRLEGRGVDSRSSFAGEYLALSGPYADLLAGAIDRGALAADLLRSDGEFVRATGSETEEETFPGGFSLAVPHGDELLSLLQRAIQIQLADRGILMDQVEVDVRTFYGRWQTEAPVGVRLLRSSRSENGVLPIARVKSYLAWSREIEGIGWFGTEPFGGLEKWWLP